MYYVIHVHMKNAPRMSVTVTYLPSLASTAHDIIMAFSDTIGEHMSSLVI